MKKNTLNILFWVIGMLSLNAQSFTDHKSFTFDVSQIDLLRVHNKYGKLTVKGTNGTVAKLRVKRTLKSSSDSKLEKAKMNVYLDSMTIDRELVFFIKSPEYHLEIAEDGRAYYSQKNWHSPDVNYKIKADFTIELEVSSTTLLYVSTHKKDLKINGMKADIIAQNHHGNLALEGISGNVSTHTHHGDISIQFDKNPTKDATFSTHHGDIKLVFQTNLSADVTMKSRHGNFFSRFDYKSKPMTLTKKVSNKKGTKFKLGGSTAVRIGNGGPQLDFKTYHGNVYLEKI